MIERRTGAHDRTPYLRSVAGWALVRIRGQSMEPTLHDGDIVIVRCGVVPTAGRLVLAKLPGERPLAVKRALRREPEGWWVERDNPDAGVDSWSVGAIRDDDIVAQVARRVWPIRRRA